MADLDIRAQIPEHLGMCTGMYRQDSADLIWTPEVVSQLTDRDVDLYLDLSCTSCIKGGGRNREYALHLLHKTSGDLREAIIRLLNPDPNIISQQDPLYSYSYQESDKWSAEEIESYNTAIAKHEKNFFLISKDIKTKTVKECVQFYYFWKKICTNEYNRMRNSRYEREGLLQKLDIHSKIKYEPDEDINNNNSCRNNLNSDDLMRSKVISTATTNGLKTVITKNITANSRPNIPHSIPPPHFGGESSSCLSSSSSPLPSNSNSTTFGGEEFPCKVCGRVFLKIKSRSAHMKRHKNEHNNSRLHRQNGNGNNNNNKSAPTSSSLR